MATSHRTCTIDGCNSTHRAKGLCNAHYLRLRIHGDPMRGPKQPKDLAECTIEGCDKKPRTRNADMCNMHYTRKWRYGDTHRHPNHRVDNPAYRTVHKRLEKDRGLAREHACVDCGGRAAHWSYDHLDIDERSSGKMEYSVKQEHYDPRCLRCHHAFDIAWEQAHGRTRRKNSRQVAPGVRQLRSGRWQVCVQVNGMKHYRSGFVTPAEAESAALQLRTELRTSFEAARIDVSKPGERYSP